MPRAGLVPATVATAAAEIADESGLAQLSMNAVADRLGVKPPSLYKHVQGLADLTHRIAVLGAEELGDAIRHATQGRAGRDALIAAAQAVREYVRQHPGRYAATVGATPTGADDPLAVAMDGTLESFAAVVRGYDLDPEQQIHAIRTIRSVLHGFTTLEASNGFQMHTDVDASFAWMIDLIDRGLRAP
ncbi:TetR-like C-terminal domain-containing protein [Microbacterium sp. M1A1_1b]